MDTYFIKDEFGKFLRNTIVNSEGVILWVETDHYAWRGTETQLGNLINKYPELGFYNRVPYVPRISKLSR